MERTDNKNIIKIEKIDEKSRYIPGLMTRCPITGAYCSHRKKIIRRKIARHKKENVMIFMIMHYTPVTDTVFEWLFKDMIRREGLTFQFVDEHGNVCENQEKVQTDAGKGKSSACSRYYDRDSQEQIFKIDGKEISLVRADDFSSNSHVNCELVCAKMQEADMVIADLSYENPNVFYELGAAMALGKKILPICYQDKYYKEFGRDKGAIRNFPWKEFLMKNFTINRVEISDDIKRYRGGDKEFSRYPYADPVRDYGRNVGDRIMDLMNDTLGNCDTLMVYTLEGFSYVEDRGRTNVSACVENYGKIVDKVRKAMEKQGDRVCLMYSDDKLEVEDRALENCGIPEDRENRKTYLERKNNIISYSFGDICRMAINQGIHDIEEGKEHEEAVNAAERLAKNHIYNSTMKMKLEYPVNVCYLKDRLLEGLDCLYKEGKEEGEYFSLLDVILANAANCSIAFMDFRKNLLQAMFWLGVFHGTGRFAIPLRFERTRMKDEEEQMPIDIAGLWNAYYFVENSYEFRRRIRLVLENIYEKRGNLKYYQKRALYMLPAETEPEEKKEVGEETEAAGERTRKSANRETEENDAEDVYEEFYKRTLWEALLEKGDVDIYPTPVNRTAALHISDWEYTGFSRVAEYVGGLNHYQFIKFKDVIRMDREKMGDSRGEESDSGSGVNEKPGSCISMGDRIVNSVTAGLLKPYENQLYGYKTCEKCEDYKAGMCIKRADRTAEENGQKKRGPAEYEEQELLNTCREEKSRRAKESERAEESRQGEELHRIFYDRAEAGERGKDERRERGTEWVSTVLPLEMLRKNETEKTDIMLYGHLVILRDFQKKNDAQGLDVNYIILEGASGPATHALAQILSMETPATEKNILTEIQRRMIRYYADGLGRDGWEVEEKQKGESEEKAAEEEKLTLEAEKESGAQAAEEENETWEGTEEASNKDTGEAGWISEDGEAGETWDTGSAEWTAEEMEEYLECLRFYLETQLSNYFLPVIKRKQIEELKKRAKGYVRGNINDFTNARLRERLCNYTIERWGEWLESHKAMEVLVEVKVKTSFDSDGHDLREIDEIKLCKDTLRLIREKEREGEYATCYCENTVSTRLRSLKIN